MLFENDITVFLIYSAEEVCVVKTFYHSSVSLKIITLGYCVVVTLQL